MNRGHLPLVESEMGRGLCTGEPWEGDRDDCWRRPGVLRRRGSGEAGHGRPGRGGFPGHAGSMTEL